jgi:hypothetical protein
MPLKEQWTVKKDWTILPGVSILKEAATNNLFYLPELLINNY